MACASTSTTAWCAPTRRARGCGAVYQLFKGTTLHAAYARYFTPPPTELVPVGSYRRNSRTPPARRLHRQRQSDRRARPLFRRRDDAAGNSRDSMWASTRTTKRPRDLIDEGQFGPALIFETFNYAKGRVYGVEFTSSYTHENLYTIRQLRLQRRAGHPGRVGAVQFRAR